MLAGLCIVSWVILNIVLFAVDSINDNFIWEINQGSDRTFDTKSWSLSTTLGKIYMILNLIGLLPYHILFYVFLFSIKLKDMITDLMIDFRINHLAMDYDYVYTYFKSSATEDAFYTMLDNSGIAYRKFHGGVEVLTRNATTVAVFYQRAINGLT